MRLFNFSAVLAILFLNTDISFGQQPTNPPNTASRPHNPAVYLLNLTPIKGGKSYTLFRNTKVHATLNNAEEIRGKVKTVSKDSIFIDFRYYAIADIVSFQFNPGTTLGAASAIGALLGIATIAVTANGGKDGERSDGENIAFFSGIGLTAVSGALLIPNYFVKKKFPRTKYEYRTINIGGY